jgi:hypothetical protein
MMPVWKTGLMGNLADGITSRRRDVSTFRVGQVAVLRNCWQVLSRAWGRS